MVARKGQMFVATVVFLTGLLFSVQQALITYSLLDTSSPFQTKEHYVISDTLGVIESSIRDATDCRAFEGSLKEILAALDEDYSAEGVVVDIEYDLNCSRWANQVPNAAPLAVRIMFTGIHEASGLFTFYNVPGSSAACASRNPTVSFSPNYRKAPAGTTGEFNVLVKNEDPKTCAAAVFDLSTSCPAAWTCALYKSQMTIAPDQTKNTKMNVTTPAGEPLGITVVSATARNHNAPAFSGTGTGKFEVA